MSLSLAIRSPARRDINHHADYIGRRNEAAGRRFYDASQEAMRRLSVSPGLGGPYENDNPELEGLRFLPIRGYENHLVFYIPTDTELIVVRVLHAAQDIESIFAPEV